MSTSSDGVFAVGVSGPSTRLAWLRALWLKTHHITAAAWSRARTVITTAVRIPRAAATATLSALSTRTGYTTVVRTTATALRLIGRAIGIAVRSVTQGLSWLGHSITTLVGTVSPSAAASLGVTARHITTPVDATAKRITGLLQGTGTVAEHLAHTPLVRTATTTAARVAAGILAVHTVSKGAVAAKIVAAIPASMDLVMALTNPWWALAAVGAVTVAAMGVALARLMSTRPDGDQHTDDDGGPDDTPRSGGVPAPPVQAVTEPPVPATEVDDVLTDMAEIAKTVHVVINTDGSVVVEGIPATVPKQLREVVARIAADAAIAHVERTLKVRSTPSRGDRRLFTKAAREALVAEAKRRRNTPEQQAA